MDHIVYLDAKARELEKLLDGKKTMIIRGATGRKLPHGRVNVSKNKGCDEIVRASLRAWATSPSPIR